MYLKKLNLILSDIDKTSEKISLVYSTGLKSINAIELLDVTKIYKIGKVEIKVLEALNFQCREKDFIIMTGPSGSGKSTLLSIIGGLTRVDEGKVRVLNHDLSSLDEEALAIFRSIYVGFVFQTGHLIDSLTVLENVRLPLDLTQTHLKEHEDQVWKLLTEFNLNNRAQSLPAMISGGEYQRTVFARALCLDPDLLLIDEPTSNQDKETRKSIICKLSSLKGKKTVIVVTHDTNIFPLADKIYTPVNGELEGFNYQD